MNVLDQAIKTFMEADTTAGGLNHPSDGAIGGFHQGVAPQNTAFPRCRFIEVDDIGVYAFAGLVADRCYYSLLFDAVDDADKGEGVALAGALAERARTKFTDPNGLSVDGKTLLYSRFQHALTPMFTKDEARDLYICTKGFILQVWLA